MNHGLPSDHHDHDEIKPAFEDPKVKYPDHHHGHHDHDDHHDHHDHHDDHGAHGDKKDKKHH
jgi:hypothetical protein